MAFLEIVLAKLAQRSTFDPHLAAVDAFLRSANLESNRYLLPELREQLERTTKQFTALRRFIAEHFFPMSGSRFDLEPELRSRSLASSKEYYAYEKQLQDLIGATRTAYREYRRLVKVVLVV